MRVISELECEMVSGGDIMPEEVRREIERAYQDALSRGLSHEDALRACSDLGNGLSATSRYVASSGTAVEALCSTAVTNYINWTQISAQAICEDVDGGTWDAAERECTP